MIISRPVDPNALLIKSICGDIEAAVGGSKNAAHMAGVCPSTWSGYINPDKADTTIPLHRAIQLQKRSKRDDFTRLLCGDSTSEPVAESDRFGLAASALSSLALIEGHLARAHAAGEETPSELRDLLSEITRLADKVNSLQVCIAQAAVTPIRRRQA